MLRFIAFIMIMSTLLVDPLNAQTATAISSSDDSISAWLIDDDQEGTTTSRSDDAKLFSPLEEQVRGEVVDDAHKLREHLTAEWNEAYKKAIRMSYLAESAL
ncbi:hypothetical protein FLK61_24855 [Paenalkalicoccus suaedae]|uniref:Uncharacterized protein n=1 Tax=Paenalkalicoccus suaedae TaxID=2592382 RepID=A0A859FAN1_9BACI|nr:hypothetical protein [Paenalkalicoccus suaedae]QKS70007.1 hypothetical protein FLK61_24855 [Paenalkalicoccus suaedae]